MLLGRKRNPKITLFITLVVCLTTFPYIISAVGLLNSPIGEYGGVFKPQSEEYPVFVLDGDFPDYCGVQLWITFTAFSNASGDITIITYVNGIQNDGYAPTISAKYFVNYLHIIDTSLLLSGVKEFKLVCIDGNGNQKEMVKNVIVDKVPPVMFLSFDSENMEVYHKDPLVVSWNCSDRDELTGEDHFVQIEFWVDGDFRGARSDRIGSISLFFILAYEELEHWYRLDIVAKDLAENTYSESYSLKVFKPEGEKPPDDWEAEVAKMKLEAIRNAWWSAASLGLGMSGAFLVGVPFLAHFIRTTGYQRVVASATQYQGEYDQILMSAPEEKMDGYDPIADEELEQKEETKEEPKTKKQKTTPRKELSRREKWKKKREERKKRRRKIGRRIIDYQYPEGDNE